MYPTKKFVLDISITLLASVVSLPHFFTKERTCAKRRNFFLDEFGMVRAM
jgi:hypothetical protein